MTIRPRRPLAAITWLLGALSSRHAADAIVGDLLEELNERADAGHPPRWPEFWLNRRALRFTALAGVTYAQRFSRTATHVIRDAMRSLRGAPAHTFFIFLVLAVGISAATVTFSVVDAVMLKPLPFDRSHEIVVVGGRNARSTTRLTPEEFWTVHDHAASFDVLGALSASSAVVTVAGATEQARILYVTADLVRVLRLKPLVGRLWSPNDDASNEPAMAVISYALWQRRFGASPDAIGGTVQLAGKAPYRIVGVLPPDAVFPEQMVGPVDVWALQVPPKTAASTYGRDIAVLARLKPSVSLAQAQAEVDALIRPLIDPTLRRYEAWRPEIERWDAQLVGNARGWLLLLLGTVTLIVLIACFNAANLMLTRSVQRVRELSVRAALGASRLQLGMTLLTESLMLSVAATLAGLAFALWGVQAVTTALPIALFRAKSIAVNGRVFVAAMTAALVTGVICGLVPAWQAGRISVVGGLKDGSSTVTGSRKVWRRIFLTAEIACVGVLLVLSTLFVASFIRVTTLDLGFERTNLIAVATVTNYQGTVDDLKARFGTIPGVTGVAAVTYSSPPIIGSAFGGAWGDSPLRPVGGSDDAPARVELYRVSADYFDVAGIQFRRGSTWSDADAANGQPMVIDERTARELFGARDPMGQPVQARDLNNRIFTIVGIVPFAYTHGPDGTTRSSAYFGMPPNYRPSWVSFLLRTTPPAPTLVPIVQDTLNAVAPPDNSAGAGVRVVQDGFRRLTATRRFNAGLMTAFGIFAVLIGAAGIYAVMASIVAQQTREIGVRVALGATSQDIYRGVLSMAARHVLLGLALGLPTAWAISQSFAALFFQVRPSDPLIYLVVTVIVAAVSVIATIVPARRAARIDPIVALRMS